MAYHFGRSMQAICLLPFSRALYLESVVSGSPALS